MFTSEGLVGSRGERTRQAWNWTVPKNRSASCKKQICSCNIAMNTMHEIGSAQQVVYAFCLTVDFPWSVAAECQNFKYFPYQEEARVCSTPWQQKQRASSLEHGTCRKDANVKQTLWCYFVLFLFYFFPSLVSFRVSIVNSSYTT